LGAERRSDLEDALAAVDAALSKTKDIWWVIGSAAAWLAGAEVLDVADIDILVSERDAATLRASWGADAASREQSPLFRSQVFFRSEQFPMPVEVMAGFEIFTDGKWRRLQPRSRVRFKGLFAPSVAEQMEILALMDRPKDALRREALRRLI
jgi:hypothetical protein